MTHGLAARLGLLFSKAETEIQYASTSKKQPSRLGSAVRYRQDKEYVHNFNCLFPSSALSSPLALYYMSMRLTRHSAQLHLA